MESGQGRGKRLAVTICGDTFDQLFILGKFQVFAFFFGRFTCSLLLFFSRNFL